MSVNYLLKEAEQPPYNRPALLDAVYKKDLERVQSILAKDLPESSVAVHGDFNENALHAACYRGLFQIAQAILLAAKEQGVALCNEPLRKLRPLIGGEQKMPSRSALIAFVAHDIQRRASTMFTETPLHAACSAGNVDLVALLVEHGAQADDSNSPLLHAVRHGHLQVTKWLLENTSLDLNVTDRARRDALCTAAEQGMAEILQALLEAGADHSRVDQMRRGPLHLAVLKRHASCVQVLAEAGVNLHAADRYGVTPCHIAARKGHLDILKALCDAGVDLNLPNRKVQECDTPLYEAILQGHEKVVNYLLERGARPDLCTATTCMLHAFFYANGGRLSLLRMLIAGGADFQFRSTMNLYTLLHLAVDKKWWDSARFLVDCGIKVKRDLFWLRTNSVDSDLDLEARNFYDYVLSDEVLHCPRTLKQTCRAALRRELDQRRDIWPYGLRIADLGLPTCLVRYMQFYL